MSTKYSGVDFVKIDVDELSVRYFPLFINEKMVVCVIDRMWRGSLRCRTFVLLKQGKEVERVIGAKKDELHNKVIKHME